MRTPINPPNNGTCQTRRGRGLTKYYILHTSRRTHDTVQAEAREAVATNAAASGSNHHPVEHTAGAGLGAVSLTAEPQTEAVSSTSLQTAPPRARAAVMRDMLHSSCRSMAWPPCEQNRRTCRDPYSPHPPPQPLSHEEKPRRQPVQRSSH